MIELGTQTAGDDLIKDTTDQDFMADVIEASRETPVIVDFWAPWCGPCKQLTPVLEAAVREAGGAVKMVKINIDENQNVAAQLRVQSIPAVFGFAGGQPVDGFMGAVTASDAKAFVARLKEQGGGDGLTEALDAADEMLEQGALADAAQVYGSVLQEDPMNARAYAGLIRAQLIDGDVAKARLVLEKVPAEIADDPLIVAIRSAIELQEQAEDAGEAGELRAQLDTDPDNHQARFDLATALIAADDTAGAIDTLLDLFRRDREWNDGAAKEQLFKLFESLGPTDPLTLTGRRKLSSMIFA